MLNLKKIIGLLDLTSLNETDNEEVINELCHKAKIHSVAAVCVYPQFVAQAYSLLKDSPVAIATVVNFPSGEQKATVVLQDIEKALLVGANEIDLVIPYQDYLNLGESPNSIALVQQAKKACGSKLLKVILETGELKSEHLIFKASQEILTAGADFIKTSTGKTTQGASLEAADSMLKAIQSSGRAKGLKISGGIRNLAQVKEYIALLEKFFGASFINPKNFRIGASSLLNDLINNLKNESTNY